MIYLTGDTHAGTDMRKLSRKQLKRQGISITENDILIITGDFGFPFLPEDIGDYENNDGEYAFCFRNVRRKGAGTPPRRKCHTPDAR